MSLDQANRAQQSAGVTEYHRNQPSKTNRQTMQVYIILLTQLDWLDGFQYIEVYVNPKFTVSIWGKINVGQTFKIQNPTQRSPPHSSMAPRALSAQEKADVSFAIWYKGLTYIYAHAHFGCVYMSPYGNFAMTPCFRTSKVTACTVLCIQHTVRFHLH